MIKPEGIFNLKALASSGANAFLDALPVPVAIIAQRGSQVVSANPRFLEMVACTAEEIQHQPFSAVFAWVDPLARQQLVALLRNEETVTQVTAPLRLRNGEERIIEFVFEPMQTDGRLHFLCCCRDLTDQLLVEAAFEESHRVLTLLMDNLPGLVYRCSWQEEGWMLRFVSEGFERLTGHSASVWIGRPLADLFAVLRHPEDQSLLDHQRAGRTLEHNTFNRVYRIITASGAERWVWEQGQQVATVPGASNVLEGFITDITHTKQAEAEIHKKSRLVNLLKHIALIANEARTIEEALQDAVEVICTFMGGALGHVWFRHQHAMDRLVPSTLWASNQFGEYDAFRRATMQITVQPGEGLVGRVLSEGQPKWMEHVTQDALVGRMEVADAFGVRSGVVVPVLVEDRVGAVMEFYSSNPVTPEVLPIDALKHIGIELGRVIERKETERALYESEQRWRSLVEDQPEVVLISVDGIFKYANKAALALFGATSADEIIGQPLTRFADPTVHACLQERHAAIERGETTEPLEHMFQRLDGEERVIEAFSVPIMYEGKPGAHTVLRDVTKRKRAEEVLQHSHDQLTRLTERLHTAREEERAHIAREIHDLLGRSLAVLKLNMEWLAVQELERPILDRIHQAREQLLETIQDVRRIATDLHPTLLDNFGLDVTLEWQATQFEAHTGLTCRFTNLTVEIQPDQKRDTHIFRIFQETLTNIARHAHAQHVWISFTKEAGHLMLVVQDDGCGISDSALEGVNSLGLVGMRERARQLGGTVDIHGQPGKGTRVRLRVPYVEAREDVT